MVRTHCRTGREGSPHRPDALPVQSCGATQLEHAVFRLQEKGLAFQLHALHRNRAKPFVCPYYASSEFGLRLVKRRAWRPQVAEVTSILQQVRLPTVVRTALSLPALTKYATCDLPRPDAGRPPRVRPSPWERLLHRVVFSLPREHDSPRAPGVICSPARTPHVASGGCVHGHPELAAGLSR